MATQFTLSPQGISCHAWNADRSMLALCPNDNTVHIYETQTWRELHVLEEHDLLVSSIDWSPVNNKIVTCSHDRNAFVWTFVPKTKDEEEAKWIKSPVHLRIDRAAMHVKWSSDGKRFAVASGAKVVPLCTWDRENDWWTSKTIKKHKSTVLCVAFHPTNGQLLATGCADFKCRVISTYTGDVDSEGPNAQPFASPVELGETYAEMSALGWVNAVAWAPSGNVLAFAAHDSSLHVATLSATARPVVRSIRFREMPLNSLIFVTEGAIIGGGHDFNPILFTRAAAGTWVVNRRLDERKEDKAASATSGVSAARALFQNKTRAGQDAKADSDTLWTQHDNAITCMANASVSRGPIDKISTSGLDGRLVVWSLPSLDIQMASLSV